MKKTLLFCLMPFLMQAQNFKQEILAAIEHMASLKSYSTQLNYKLYLGNDLKKPFQQSSTEIRKEGSNLFYKESDGTEYMENERYEIQVNNESKSMSVRKKDPLEKGFKKATFFSTSPEELDLYFSVYNTIKVISASGTHTEYELILKQNEELESVCIRVNTQKKLIEGVRYKYKKSTVIPELNNTRHKVTFEVSYENFKPDPGMNATYFNEKKYLDSHRGSLKAATPKYTGYKLDIVY